MRRYRVVKALLGLLVKNPKIVAAAALAAAAFYLYELQVARPAMVFRGVPKAQSLSADTFTRIFRNKAYLTGYSDIRGNPLWVVYRLAPLPANAPFYKRPDGFRTDWRNLTFVSQGDYTRSGYDRGHMAPNYAISRLYGQNAQEETFLMTNITPQRANLNQKVWQRLEELEIDRFARRFEELWVYTGPIFDAKIGRLKSSFKVEIPDAFYKVYAGVHDNGLVEMAAFIIPQRVRGNESLDRFSVSVDQVEEKIGFDFFYDLDPAYEVTLESENRGKRWLRAAKK